MLYTIIPSQITRKWILEKVSQEQIFAHYLGISIVLIQDCVYTNKLICNPLRTDRHPTAGFYTAGDRLRFNDFAGYFHGDCFDLVGYVYLLNPYDKQDHARILEKVAIDFGLIAIGQNNHSYKRFDYIEKEDYEFTILPRQWNTLDKQYWKEYGITEHQLNESFTYPVEDLYINNKRVYTYSFADPAYAYYIGPYKGKKRWKIYFPKRTNFRFLTNTRYMDLLNIVKPATFGVVTQSRKSALVLHSFGVQAVAVSGESTLPVIKEMELLRRSWRNIVTLFDFDKSGVRLTHLMRKTYNTIPALLTNGRFNSLNFFPGIYDSHKKDIADYISIYGSNYLGEIINFLSSLQAEEVIKELKQPSNDFIDLYQRLYPETFEVEDENEDEEDIPF